MKAFVWTSESGARGPGRFRALRYLRDHAGARPRSVVLAGFRAVRDGRDPDLAEARAAVAHPSARDLQPIRLVAPRWPLAQCAPAYGERSVTAVTVRHRPDPLGPGVGRQRIDITTSVYPLVLTDDEIAWRFDRFGDARIQGSAPEEAFQAIGSGWSVRKLAIDVEGAKITGQVRSLGQEWVWGTVHHATVVAHGHTIDPSSVRLGRLRVDDLP